MGLPRFIKLAKAKQFNYKPLYYNQQKEEFEQRVKNIELEYNHEHKADVPYVSRIQKGFLRDHAGRSNKSRRGSNFRVIIIMIILLFVAYALFYM